jgi:hypothetical protein
MWYNMSNKHEGKNYIVLLEDFLGGMYEEDNDCVCIGVGWYIIGV